MARCRETPSAENAATGFPLFQRQIPRSTLNETFCRRWGVWRPGGVIGVGSRTHLTAGSCLPSSSCRQRRSPRSRARDGGGACYPRPPTGGGIHPASLPGSSGTRHCWYISSGGLGSRCGNDPQAYVDALLPPPDSDTTALAASDNATLFGRMSRGIGRHCCKIFLTLLPPSLPLSERHEGHAGRAWHCSCSRASARSAWVMGVEAATATETS
jgi:hypothetical protein